MSTSNEHKRKGFGTRSKYTQLNHFRLGRKFQVWWETRQHEWRLNTRYNSSIGRTEYWHCNVCFSFLT